MVKNKKVKIILSIIVVMSLSAFTVTQSSSFGKSPKGERSERIKKSPNFKDGKFRNIHYTPTMPEGYTMMGEIYKTFFKKNPRKFPTDTIPSVKTNLLNLPIDSNVIVWFGHSSYFLQIDGKRFLVDPVFSGHASPFSFAVKAFKGTDRYTADSMPEIDYLLITHDHFDHLDYKTVKALNPKVKQVICGLGVGEYFESRGYNPNKIIEKDWNETYDIAENFKIHAVTAAHGSGRFLSTDKTLWVSFVLEAPSMRIFLGGDGGYDTHFAEIGKKYGVFDLAILENGQYADDSNSIHMSPGYVIKAAKDLNAKRLDTFMQVRFVSTSVGRTSDTDYRTRSKRKHTDCNAHDWRIGQFKRHHTGFQTMVERDKLIIL